jgi:hypothetical protein
MNRVPIASILTSAAGSLVAAGVVFLLLERRGIAAHARRWWERGCA